MRASICMLAICRPGGTIAVRATHPPCDLPIRGGQQSHEASDQRAGGGAARVVGDERDGSARIQELADEFDGPGPHEIPF